MKHCTPLMVCHQSEIKERLWCRVHNRRLVWFWLKKNYFSRMVWFWPRKNYFFGVVWFWPTKNYFSGLVWFWPKDNNFPGLGGFCWSKEARFQYQAGDHHTLLKCVTLGRHQGHRFFKYEDEGRKQFIVHGPHYNHHLSLNVSPPRARTKIWRGRYLRLKPREWSNIRRWLTIRWNKVLLTGKRAAQVVPL